MIDELKNEGYECACAFATNEEVEAGAACGQLSIITDKKDQRELKN